jgi:probable F420-dependent oxidoreductase
VAVNFNLGPGKRSIPMKIGISMFVTDYSVKPGELARAVEERGFESLWFPEHTHIPISRKSPWPGGPNLPDVYKHTLDPFMALTAAAMETKRIKLATGICLVVERDPIHTAKNVATIDYLSGGRFVFGIGGGWNAEEMVNHGTVFKTRFPLMRERIEAMKAIWSNDVAEYHGEHVNFDPLWAWPKPVQRPHPPILVGGEFPHGAKRAIAFGDGWMPIGGRGLDALEILPRFRQMVAEAGRNPDDMPMSVFGAPQNAERLQRYRDAGVDRAIFMLPTAARDQTLKNLDACAAAWPAG